MSEGGCASAVSGDLRSGGPHRHYLSIYVSINIKSRKNFLYHILICYIVYRQHMKKIIFHTNKPSLLKTIRSDACAKPCLYRDAPNPTSCNKSHQNIRLIHSEQTENLIYPSLKIKRPSHTKLLAPNNSITDLSYTRFG